MNQIKQKKIKQKKIKYNNNYNKIEHLDNISNKQSSNDKKPSKSSLNDDFFVAKNKKKLKEIEKLHNMSEMETMSFQNFNKPLYDLSIYEIYLNCKKTWQDIIIQLDTSKISSPGYLLLFFKEKNRKFYLGISLIIIGLILYIFDTLLIG